MSAERSTSGLAPDPVVIQEWFDWWFHHAIRGEIQVGWRDGTSGSLNRFRGFDIGADNIGDAIAAINAVPGQSCYFRASTVRAGLGATAAEDSDFAQAVGCWGDLDDGGAKARAAKVATIIRPSAWVETGVTPHWRAQAFWRFDGACENPAAVEHLNRRVVALYGSDPAVVNPTRLMRVPGTIAWPSKPGRVAEVTRLVVPKGRAQGYTIEFLTANLPQENQRQEQQDKQDWRNADVGGETVAALLRAIHQPGNWHNGVLRLVAHWVGRGFSDAEILAFAEHITLPGFSVADTRRDLATMIQGARRKWGVEDKDHKIGPEEPASPFGGEPADPWETLKPVPFPMDALPPLLRDFATSRAAAIGCDPAAVAMTALCAISTAIDGFSRLRMKQHDKWSVPPALWVALIGPSSYKKSPPVRAAWHPLEALGQTLLREYAARLREWESTDKEMRGDKPRPPVRYVTHDATMEALQGILSAQSRGVGVVKDELAGLVGSMDKYSAGRGGAADRAFWLQAFDGGTHVVDRVGRGTVALDNLLVSICGGIQPDRLAAFGDLTDDGLWQRFIPVIMAPPQLGQDVPAGQAEERYEDLIGRIVRLPTLFAVLTPAARAEREAAERRLFEEETSEQLGAAFSSFVGKLHGLWGRLALVLHVASEDAPWEVVDRPAAEAASRLVFDYILRSAAQVYATMGVSSGKGEPLKDVAGYILTKRLTRLLASDLTRNVRCCRGASVAEIQRIVSRLEAAGWLAPETDKPGNSAWLVNPRVHEAFAERAQKEAERRARARALISDGGAEHE